MQERELILLFLFSWFWVNFEPIQNPIKKILKAKYLISYWLRSLLTCWFCFALWSSLTYFHFKYGISIDLVVKSLAVSFVSWFIQKLLK